MDNKKILAAFFVFFYLSICLSTSVNIGDKQEGGEDTINISVGGRNVEATGVDCFDYYHFGLVEFDYPRPEKTVYKTGETASIVTTIINNNEYAIVQGNVIAQVYYTNKESGNYQGDHLLAEFIAFDGLALAPKQAYDLAVEWQIPKDAPKGRYDVALYFQELHTYNMSGLPFITNYYGGLASFDVESANENLPFYFDRNAVLLNGEKQLLRHFSKNFEKGEKITYEVPIVNPTTKSQSVSVTYQLYSWDQSDEKNLLVKYSKNENMEIGAKSSKKASINFNDLEAGAYELKITASNNAWNSILLLRFTVKGAKGRFIHTGLTAFPLLKGDNFTMFACFSNTTDWFTNFNGEVVLELKDNKGNILGTETFRGEITPKIMAIKKDLKATECYDELHLTARIKDSGTGKIHQEITKVYRLADFRDANLIDKFYEEKAKIEAKPTPTKTVEETRTQVPVKTQEPTKTPLPKEEFPSGILLVTAVAAIIIVGGALYYIKKVRK
ncbi:MAG: hypothetical protein N3F05_04725 [Candidatus Diapherotrites archaeon]|nr:hypothetical protein [Candidatus Diapherotrites archaeon]